MEAENVTGWCPAVTLQTVSAQSAIRGKVERTHQPDVADREVPGVARREVGREPLDGICSDLPACRREVDLVLSGLGHGVGHILSIRCPAIRLAMLAPLGWPAQKMNSKSGEFLEFLRVRDSGRSRVPNAPWSRSL